MKDLQKKFDQGSRRSVYSRPSAINIVILDGNGHPDYTLDSIGRDGNIIMPLEILLDEGPQVKLLHFSVYSPKLKKCVSISIFAHRVVAIRMKKISS